MNKSIMPHFLSSSVAKNIIRSSLIMALVFTSAPSLYADTYDEVLMKILNANSTLLAEKAVADAEIQDNLTGLNLPNPEVEFAYQWGTPGSSPDKKILDVSQSFDFATLSGSKRRVARTRNAIIERNYISTRMATAAEIDRLMTEGVYLHHLSRLYADTDSLMAQFERASYNRLQLKDLSPHEYNSILIQRHNTVTDEALHQIDIDANCAQLQRLAGGQLPHWAFDKYSSWTLPDDFDTWWSAICDGTPEVTVATAERALAREEISLRRKEGLPSFSLGYTSEMIFGDNHYGVALGFELPLWSNHGRVKAAKAAAAASNMRLDDIRYAQRADAEIKYKRAAALAKACAQVEQIRRECGDTTLLKNAFDEGAITLDDYLNQLIALLDLDKRLLETERDYQLALVELRAITAQY